MTLIRHGQSVLLLPSLSLCLFLLTACSQTAPLEGRSRTLQSGGSSGADILERDELTVRVSSMAELLAHRFPGVIVRGRGSGAWIEIRGPNSINSGTAALIIVDGIESSTRGLLAMNPNYVQRVEVLKGASASIYGLRGGNGVLVVTTRRIDE